MEGGCLPHSVVLTTRHLLKHDHRRHLPPLSLDSLPPTEETAHSSVWHKGRAGLNGLNGSTAPGHGGSDQLNGPHCVAAVVTGGSQKRLRPFKRPFGSACVLSRATRQRHRHFHALSTPHPLTAPRRVCYELLERKKEPRRR